MGKAKLIGMPTQYIPNNKDRKRTKPFGKKGKKK